MLRTTLLLAITFLLAAEAFDYKRVCYWASWAVYRPGDGKHLVQNIDPDICTHLIYTFAKITPSGILTSYDPWCDYDDGLGNFKKFNDLKKRNPNLKTILAVGGWNMGSVVFSNMAQTQEGRKKFIDSSLAFVRKYDFDGLDLDWEYPADRGGKAFDKPHFTELCKEFKKAFEEEGRATGREPLLITAAVSAGYTTIDKAYEVHEIAKYLDFINLMTYDLHGAWEKFADHNSPLFARKDQEDFQKTLTTDFAVNYWLKHGTPPRKLILGIPLYGRTFNLANAQNNKPGAAVTGPGPSGPFTRENGILSYYEICTNFKTQSGWNRIWQEEYKAPYAVKGNFWVGYDDTESIKIKSEYIKDKGLGGAMVWSIEQDDYRNTCGEGRDILLNVIKSVLTTGKPSSTYAPQSTVKTTVRPTYPTPGTKPPRPSGEPEVVECETAGFYPDPNDCSRFFQCVQDQNGMLKYEFSCGDGLYYDPNLRICNYKHAVKCSVSS